ncbi:MAG: ComEC/Rec2 family competence protein, partial [Planctomycetes bacterium]|nr:ComEC/Rec2 family competence protein [Planctomycetota bacterium]
MLARRPLLVYAIAAMAGIVWARYYPAWIGWTAMAACIVFVCLTAWYLLTPYPLRPPPESLPEEYRPHILPVPGFFARRGLNRFMLITSLVCLLLGMARQWRHGEDMAAERLPETDFFTATFIPLSPRTDYPGQEEWWRVPALLVSVGGEPADGIRVRLTGRAGPDFRRGDLVSARVRKEYVPVRAFPHAFDPRFWLERDRQAAGLAVVRSRENAAAYQVVLLDDVSTYTRVRRALDAIRAVAIGKTLQYGGEAGGLLAAMLYGYRREIAEPVRDSFRRVGIGHVLAISGLHVGLIVMLLWWLSGLWSWSGRWRAIACLILVLAYLCLSGGQVAASRASFMAVIHLAGIAWGRRADMLNSLGAAAFVIALRNPTAPLDIGFQLSFTAVFFIHLSRPEPIPDPEMEQERRRKKLLSPWQRFARHLRAKVFSLIRLSIYTWIGLFPIIALIFNQINLIGLPINVLVIPWMGAVLAAGLLLPIFGWIPGVSWL